MEIHNFSRRHINFIVKRADGESSWKLTSFYGHPNWSKRHELWALLRYLQSYRPTPWLVIGDFNEILTQDEKSEIVMAREGQMKAFRDVFQDCSLSDLGFTGSIFTWNNDREGDDFIKERLDRAVANREWCAEHHLAEVWVLAARSSDHKPLCLRMGRGDDVRQRTI